MDILSHVFGTTQEVTWWQMSARAVLILLYGLVLLRLSGQRIFARTSPADVVLAVVIGSNFSRALTANAPLFQTLAATTVMLAVYWGLIYSGYFFDRVRRAVKGGPIPLIQNGTMVNHAMLRFALTEADLTEEMRKHGIADIKDVEAAYMEADGSVTVLKRPK